MSALIYVGLWKCIKEVGDQGFVAVTDLEIEKQRIISVYFSLFFFVCR